VGSGEPPTWRLVVSRRAARDLERLPSRVANAVVELITGPLAANPHLLGKALAEPWGGCRAARRGDYRIIYRLDEELLLVEILTVGHRADADRAP
jgi:mRNA-degrading endonuclease RelE of RelBE toxin-antitoxin system